MIRHSHRQPSGFSLLEMMVAVALFILIVCAIFGVLGSSQTLLQESGTQADLELTARRVLNRVEEDFLAGILNTVDPVLPVNSKSVSVIPAAGYANGSVAQGLRVKYDLLAEAVDPANGKDDDGDGFVDEGSVVRTAGVTATTIAGNVKDLRFTLNANALTCTITLERTVRGSRTFTVTDSESIRLRN